MSQDQFHNSQTLAVLVDVQAFGAATQRTDIQAKYADLLSKIGAGRRLRRATAYAALDPQSVEQAEALAKVRGSGFRIVRKPLKSLSDGSIHGYMGVEIAVDILLAAETCDIVAIVTGDADILPAVEAAQAKGARIEIFGCPGQNLDALSNSADSFELVDGATPEPEQDGATRTIDRPPPRSGPQQRHEWPTPPPPPPPERPDRQAGQAGRPGSTAFRVLEGESISGSTPREERSDESRPRDTPPGN